MTQRQELRRLLLEHSIKRGDFLLASGQRSNFYVDVRRTVLCGPGAAAVGEVLADMVDEHARGIGGMTMGADPLVTAVSCAAFARGRVLHGAYVRKEPKGHGTEQWVEAAGALQHGDRLVVLDDVVTTAGSTIKAVERLRAAGFVCEDALCVVDRGAGGISALAEIGVELRAVFHLDELVDAVP